MEQQHKPQLEKQLLLLGRNMITSLFVLLKTAQNYAEGHKVMSSPVTQFLTMVREIHRLNSEAAITVKTGSLSLGNLRLKPDTTGFEAFRFVAGTLHGYFIRSITFTPAVTDLEIKRFAYIFTEIAPMPAPQTCLKFQERLQQRMIEHIELESMSEDQELVLIDEAVDIDNRAKARRIYSQAMREVEEVTGLAGKRKPLPLMKSKRIVQKMVDQLVADQSHLLALTNLRSNKAYTCNHSVNVAVLSLAIGQRVGLSKSRLCDLGIVSLYHDIGKAFIPGVILHKGEEFSREEEEIVQGHPLLGVKALMELKAPDALAARMIGATFEHHLHYDFSGYPRLPSKRQGLFSRIIGIADDYDSLTSARVYNRAPHSPEKVIRFMLSRSCRIYDPVLIKLFVNAMGIYPIGTLLLLNSRELAVVMRNNPDPAKWSVPVVKVVAYGNGEEIDGEMINLADTGSRSIVRAIDPHQSGIDVAPYLI